MRALRALVTGPSTGIGRTFARERPATGYAVTAVAPSKDRLRTLVDELGSSHRYLVADLATTDGQGLIADELARHLADLLVNNAGAAHHGPFTETTARDALTAIRLNCEAVVTLAHAFLAQARPGDALINVSSTLAYAPTPGLAVHSASKAFVTSLSKALWHEQRPCRVYVMGLCPGMTATDSQFLSHEDATAALIQTPEALVAAAPGPRPPRPPHCGLRQGECRLHLRRPPAAPQNRPRAAQPPALIRPARPLRPPERPGKTVQQIADIP
ncbi:SDR family NAD(P)-dependent oxidoreductase [Streptomyces sp. NPDC006514]|uniref:SDR family NAD(P)-dependent oxidoreductase n=1 Tax=Streptomyces sp. NPDC006514 TaxID=3154308 RepID=UPI0033B8473B